jgi:hypothetical protein
MTITVKQLHQFLRRHLRSSAMTAIAVFLVLLALIVQAAEPTPAKPQQSEKPKAPAAKPPEVIPVAEIATQAMAVSNRLSDLTAKTAPRPEIKTIKKSLPEIRANIEQQIMRTVVILQQQPTPAALQTQQQQWEQIQAKATDWLNVLTEQATLLQNALNSLAGLQKTWNNTRIAMQTSKQPGPVLQQINSTLSAIAAAQASMQAQLNNVLDLQGRVASELERCGAALSQINRAEQLAVKGILSRDSKPLWSDEHWSEGLTTLVGRGSKTADAFKMELLEYVRNPSEGLPMFAVLFVVLMIMFCAARQRIRKLETAGAPVSPARPGF